METEKCVKAGKMYMKNNDTYFNLIDGFFVLQFTVLFVLLIKGNVHQLFLELDLTIIFH